MWGILIPAATCTGKTVGQPVVIPQDLAFQSHWWLKAVEMWSTSEAGRSSVLAGFAVPLWHWYHWSWFASELPDQNESVVPALTGRSIWDIDAVRLFWCSFSLHKCRYITCEIWDYVDYMNLELLFHMSCGWGSFRKKMLQDILPI